jgi:glutathione S-transferase
MIGDKDMALPTLTIGNKNYSSWSMRPWLALRWADLRFEEKIIPLGPRGLGPNPDLLAVSPTGTVPVLELASGERIWDSLSICEWAHEQAPEAKLWPEDNIARALARSAVAEMHSGFAAIRKALPMNIKRVKRLHDLSAETQAQIDRLDALLRGLITRFGGGQASWIFGHPTIADAFFAPVATRLRTYKVKVSAPVEGWCQTVFSDSAFRAWEAAARNETWTLTETDEA